MVTPRLPSASLSRFCACARVRVRAFSRGGMNAAAKRPFVLSPCRPARSNLEASPAFAFDVLDATKKMMTHKGRGERANANNSGNLNHNHFMPARRLPAWWKHLVETPGRNVDKSSMHDRTPLLPTERHYRVLDHLALWTVVVHMLAQKSKVVPPRMYTPFFFEHLLLFFVPPPLRAHQLHSSGCPPHGPRPRECARSLDAKARLQTSQARLEILEDTTLQRLWRRKGMTMIPLRR